MIHANADLRRYAVQEIKNIVITYINRVSMENPLCWRNKRFFFPIIVPFHVREDGIIYQ